MPMNIQPEEKKFIDVKAIFYNKNPRLARFVPKFIFKYLKHIVHEDFMNDFLIRHEGKKNIDFLEAVINEFNVSIETIGDENLQDSGRFIFAANHPIGGFDGMVLIKVLARKYNVVM